MSFKVIYKEEYARLEQMQIGWLGGIAEEWFLRSFNAPTGGGYVGAAIARKLFLRP